MTEFLDISVPLTPGIVAWPGSPGFSRRLSLSHAAGDGAEVSIVTMDVHTATHVDAPRHFLPSGAPMASLQLDTLVGIAHVLDFRGESEITGAMLEDRIPSDCERVLLHTSNSARWASGEFEENFVALTEDAAEWVVERSLRLIGIDYMSIQRFHDGPRTHTVLLEAGVVILEGLSLDHVEAGPYELMCLPLSIPDAEGAPARAVLRKISKRS